MTTDLSTHTTDVRAYDAWAKAHASVRSPPPKIGEMVTVLAVECTRLSASVGAVATLNAEAHNAAEMRRLVVMEAAVELLLRVKAHAAEWPKGVQKILKNE